ncbi:hypothetical protein PFISCL1PPCAC_28964 [Pristionchus fissidentatus]|uniref:RING-type domain-containing protein n=1 Tax=Pristionchus fissidentatus TaxID=1538716 RepID=A0AAV5X2G7_9BILA|nr:hypothetical protein PFISCL1PPCAC_28964 [Pristionchus fissidentatus]
MASLLQSSRPRDSLLFPRTSQMMILHEHLKDGERDFVYIRSLTRRMFDRIRELRCTKCTTLLSSRTPPWTGPCGHFFCNDHKGINFTTNPDDVYEKHHVCDESGEVPIPSSRTGSVTNNLLLRDVHSAMATRSAFSCVDCKGIHPSTTALAAPNVPCRMAATELCACGVLRRSTKTTAIDFDTSKNRMRYLLVPLVLSSTHLTYWTSP